MVDTLVGRWAAPFAGLFKDAGAALLVALAGFAFLCVYAAAATVDGANQFVYLWAYQVPAIVALGLAFIPIRHARGRERLGWLCLAVLLVMWTIADSLYSYDALDDGHSEFPALADVFYFLGYAAAAPALPLLTFSMDRVRPQRWLLDTLVFMLSAATLSWVFVMHPTINSNDGDHFAQIVALAYPVMDLGLLAPAVLAIYVGSVLERERALLIGASLVLLIAADTVYTYQVAHGLGTDGASSLDLLWLGSYVLLGILFVSPAARPAASAGQEPATRPRGLSAIRVAVPYLGLVPLVIAALLASLWKRDEPMLTAAALAGFGIVALRQLTMLRENQDLLERVRSEGEFRLAMLRAQSDLGEALLLLRGSRVAQANDAAIRITGRTEQELREAPSWRIILSPPQRDIETDTFADGRTSEISVLRPDGSTVDVEVAATTLEPGPEGARLVVGRDITARKNTELALFQSQKMEGLGQLAGGIAHDFNNILSTISLSAAVLRHSTQLAEEDRDSLGFLEDAAVRGAAITGRLLAFSRSGPQAFEPVDLGEVISETLALAMPAMPPDITIEKRRPVHPVIARGDSAQLTQALLNIVLNARDAMGERGTLSIALAAADGAATIRVSDDGPGMDEATRRRVFEPFFTTKPAGSGTGLGLPTAYGIIRGHGGEISVESSPGAGAAFTITLPVKE